MHSGILSDIPSIFLASSLTYTLVYLTFFLAFFGSSGPDPLHSLLRSRYGGPVQAPSTASAAGEEEEKERKKERRKRRGRRGRSYTFVEI